MQCCAHHVGSSQVRDITTLEHGSREHTGKGGPEDQDGYSGELHDENSMRMFDLTMQ